MQEITKPVTQFNCYNDDYIRKCKLINEGNSLLICGESTSVSVWDLNCGGAPRLKVKIKLTFLWTVYFILMVIAFFFFEKLRTHLTIKVY